MNLSSAILLVATAFTTMEFVAWFTHKYVMHGFLWSLHESHHKKTKGFFELNDFYFLFFGSLGASFLVTGIVHHDWRMFIGIGISLYGMTYLVVHDIIIHKRLKVFGKINNPYFKAIERAHRSHHSKATKHDTDSFGLLVVSKKFFKSR